MQEPPIPEGITGRELDPETRGELLRLSKETAERVAAHLVAAGALFESDPERAQHHAQFAARIGGRVGAVRETYGVLAYAAGDYRTAIKELRTALRITGRSDLLPMIADCERGLGRPERALDLASSPEAEQLSLESTIELMIVVAGAYADTGDVDTALATLEIPALRQKVDGRWQVRLWVAYADLLERAGRTEEAHRWLTLAADADTEQITDAAERLGRPPVPVAEPGPWEDDERLTVLDAFVDIEDEPAPEPADATDRVTDADAEADGEADDSDAVDEPESEAILDVEPAADGAPDDDDDDDAHAESEIDGEPAVESGVDVEREAESESVSDVEPDDDADAPVNESPVSEPATDEPAVGQPDQRSEEHS